MMKNALLGFCLSFMLVGCMAQPPAAAPEFDLENVTGGRLTSADFKGKVVLVDFWATWCVPCKQEIPHYNEFIAKMEGKDVEILGITFDSGDSAKDVQPFLDELAIKYPVVMGTDEVDAGFGGHPGYPTTFLVGKDWKVRKKFIGSTPTKMKDIEAAVTKLLAE